MNLLELIKQNPSSKSTLFDAFSLMEKALVGNLQPNFYVSPIDTGLGKSTLIKCFFRYWKAKGFEPGGGILLALNTKAEIEEFARTSGLDEADYAAYTSDIEFDKLGVTKDLSNKAPVLFTTHAMLRAKTRKKKFKFSKEFFYNGRPRTLRLWDERALRAEPIHIALDDMVKILGSIRPYAPEWIEAVEEFIGIGKRSPVGTVLTVPKRFGAGKPFVAVDGVAPILTDEQSNIYRQLKAAQGKSLRVCEGKWYGKTLVGSGDRLPSDLAPMFIFDASARIGDTYELWGKNGEITMMPALVRDYRNLTVRIWKTACGKSVLEDGSQRSRILNGIAKTLNLDPQPTLLIGSKARPSLFNLHAELGERLDDADGLHFRHWGIHYGTNEFSAIKRLVVIGAYRNRDTVDQAIYMAASGADPHRVTGNEYSAIARAEMQQNLLQAFSRGNIRTGVNGECGECVVYLVAPPGPDPEELVRETFPGCQIEAWEPFGAILKGQAKAVFDVLDEMVKAGRTGEVPKLDVRMRVTIASPSRFSQVLANPSLANALKQIGVTSNARNFVISPVVAPTASIALLRRRWLEKPRELPLAA